MAQVLSEDWPTIGRADFGMISGEMNCVTFATMILDRNAARDGALNNDSLVLAG
jgi:hypothetical protein